MGTGASATEAGVVATGAEASTAVAVADALATEAGAAGTGAVVGAVAGGWAGALQLEVR